MNIEFVGLKREYCHLKKEIDSAVTSVLESGNYILGESVSAFETEYARYCGVRNGIGVASGTDAITLALGALGVGRGDEVITVPNTYIATANAISHNNAKPVFVDIDTNTYTIDPTCIRDAVTERTKAIVPVHLYGHPADMQPIMEIAEEKGLFVIEDACQAHGAEYRGKRAGALGDAAAFSFYPTKNLGCCGDGGIITTNNNDIANKIAELRNYGQRRKHEHVQIGYNSRLDELQAAILRVKLKHLEEWVNKRNAIAGVFNELLPSNIITPFVSSKVKHAFHLYVIQTDKRFILQRKLMQSGIATAIHYPTPIYRQIAYSGLGFTIVGFPFVDYLSNRILSLPIHPFLELNELEYIVEQIHYENCKGER